MPRRAAPMAPARGPRDAGTIWMSLSDLAKSVAWTACRSRGIRDRTPGAMPPPSTIVVRSSTFTAEPIEAPSTSTMSDAITSQLKQLYAADSATQLVITGHSLGSTVATLSVPIACSIGFAGVHYNEGSPRVGDPTFVAYINGLSIPTYRLVNIEDVVPTVPPPEAPVKGGTLIYQHAGTPVSFSAQYGSVPSNHDPCCSYAYAIFNPDSPMNPDPASCTSGS